LFRTDQKWLRVSQRLHFPRNPAPPVSVRPLKEHIQQKIHAQDAEHQKHRSRHWRLPRKKVEDATLESPEEFVRKVLGRNTFFRHAPAR
jgi:hypothetical protein